MDPLLFQRKNERAKNHRQTLVDELHKFIYNYNDIDEPEG